MNLTDQSEKDSLVKYVSQMYDYTDNPERVLQNEDLDKDIEDTLEVLCASKYCNSCSCRKMYDEIHEEYYCPMCQ